MQVRAVERWLDEGWTPWRIAYGGTGLVATSAGVYGYAVAPHHPGAVWWLLAALAVVATWALSEAGRWRIKYRRLVRKLEASSSPAAVPLNKLAADGQGLLANLGNHMAWWGTKRLLPDGIPGRLIRWESDVDDALADHPELRILFRDAPKILVSRPLSGLAFGRLEYQLEVLGAVTNGKDEKEMSGTPRDAIAEARTRLTLYYSKRTDSTQELHQRGCDLRNRINSSGNPESELNRGLARSLDRWENDLDAALMYWGDLGRLESLVPDFPSSLPRIREISERIERELEMLSMAMKRLRESCEWAAVCGTRKT